MKKQDQIDNFKKEFEYKTLNELRLLVNSMESKYIDDYPYSWYTEIKKNAKYMALTELLKEKNKKRLS